MRRCNKQGAAATPPDEVHTLTKEENMKAISSLMFEREPEWQAEGLCMHWWEATMHLYQNMASPTVLAMALFIIGAM